MSGPRASCELWVDGTRVPDTGIDLVAGTATALEGLTIAWGRDGQNEQPGPASCQFELVSRLARNTFLDNLHVGSAVDVWAEGAIPNPSVSYEDTMDDGSFDTYPLGPLGAYGYILSFQLTGSIITGPPGRGRIIRCDQSLTGDTWTVLIPPRKFSPPGTLPDAWDDIPQAGVNDPPWRFAVAVRAPLGTTLALTWSRYNSPYAGAAGWSTLGPTVAATGEWQYLTRDIAGSAMVTEPGWWIGLAVIVKGVTKTFWSAATGVWSAHPEPWVTGIVRALELDEAYIGYPSGGTPVRRVLAFSGAVSDITASPIETAVLEETLEAINRMPSPWDTTAGGGVAARYVPYSSAAYSVQVTVQGTHNGRPVARAAWDASGLGTLDATNAASNPAFEGGSLNGYGSPAPVQYPLTLDTARPISGARSAMSTRTADSPSLVVGVCNVRGMADDSRPPVTAGAPVTVSIDIRIEAAARFAQTCVYYFDTTGVVIGNSGWVQVVPVANQTTRIVRALTPPAGTVTISMNVEVWSNSGVNVPAGERVWYDRLRVGADATYFDGSTATSDAYQYRWVGAPNASASERRLRITSNRLGIRSHASANKPSIPAGMIFTFSADIFATTDYPPGWLNVIFRDDANNDSYAATVMGPSDAAFPRGQWFRRSWTAQVKAGRTVTAIYLDPYTSPSVAVPVAARFETTRWQVVEGVAAQDYFDGDTPASAQHVYRWTGTRGASTSERVAGRLVAGTGLSVRATAMDLGAELANRVIGDLPWPAQPMGIRALRVAELAGISSWTNKLRIDSPLGDYEVSYRDVDAQAALQLLQDLAQSAGGTLWAATHAITHEFLWIENPALRESIRQFVESGDGSVVITGGGGRLMSACDLLLEPVKWNQDSGDVVTVVAVSWLEQTLDDAGQPSPTDRTITVSDADAIATYGTRRLSYGTELTQQSDAADIADRLLAQARAVQWRLDGLVFDTALVAQQLGTVSDHDRASALMDLLDGTIRMGAGVTLVDMPPYAPHGATSSVYVEGGRYAYEAGAWRLELTTTPSTGQGESATWSDLVPQGWAWSQFSPAIAWSDCFGTGVG